MIKVSIIMPMFNAASSIERNINLILRQSFSDFELILVNDGSKDDTEKIILTKFNDDRVRYYYKENGGPSTARNFGLDKAVGQYVLFIDSDDCLFSEDSLLGYVTNMEPISLYVCNYIFESKRSNYKQVDEKIEILPLSQLALEKVVTNNLLNSPFNKLFDNSIIQENKIRFDESVKMGEDLIFNLKYLKYIKNIVLDMNVRYIYFDQEEGSLSKKYFSNLYEIFEKIYNAFEELIKSNDSLQWGIIFNTHLYKSLFHMVYTAIVVQGEMSFYNTVKTISNINKSYPAKDIVSNSDSSQFTKFMKLCLFLLKNNFITLYVFVMHLAKAKSKNMRRG